MQQVQAQQQQVQMQQNAITGFTSESRFAVLRSTPENS
jgi:hypothetical protein